MSNVLKIGFRDEAGQYLKIKCVANPIYSGKNFYVIARIVNRPGSAVGLRLTSPEV